MQNVLNKINTEYLGLVQQTGFNKSNTTEEKKNKKVYDPK